MTLFHDYFIISPYAFKSLLRFFGVIQTTNMCVYLHPFDRSQVPRLVDYVQYLHVIGQTTLDVLGNIQILARTCPV